MMNRKDETTQVNFKLSKKELDILEAQRGRMSRSAYLRQLRPLFRSEMSMRGMDEKVIDMQTGHVSPHTGRRVYDQRTYEERLAEHLRVGPLLV